METLETYTIEADNLTVKVNILGGKGAIKKYEVVIPEIAPATKALLEYVKRGLVSEVAITTKEILDPKAVKKLKEKFTTRAQSVLKTKLPNMAKETSILLINVLMQDMLGLGRIEYLLNDEQLEEIVILSSQEPVRVYHKKYGWLETNILIPDEATILNYANIIGRRVGRQISTLTPLLDAHLITGDRSNAVLFPISTKGHTITIRKFARDPWTVTDFIKMKTCSPRVFALIWLAIQYEMNVLISGGTGSGKTSFLNVCMPFIPLNHRILSIEDSVTGDAKILYEEKGILQHSTMGNLINKAIDNKGYKLHDGTEIAENNSIKIFSMNKEGNIELKKPSSLIRHKVKKDILDIYLASGRKISVTADHSLFGLQNNKITPIPGKTLAKGDLIATPRTLPFKGKDIVFDLSNHLHAFEKRMVTGEPLQHIITNHIQDLKKLVTKSALQSYKRNSRLPVTVFKQLHLKLTKQQKKQLFITPKRSGRYHRVSIPFIIPLDEDLVCLAGLWLADGCYDKNSIIFSVPEKETRNIVKRCAKKFDTKPRLHSDGLSLMINSAVLKEFFINCLQLQGNAYTKEYPAWCYTLKKQHLQHFIKGYYSGDGWARQDEIVVSSRSFDLIEGLQTLLLRFEIPLRFNRERNSDGSYESRISSVKFIQRFIKEIGGFLQPYKNRKLHSVLQRSIKDATDIIPLDKTTYLPLKHLIGQPLKNKLTHKSWKSWQGQYKKSHIGRNMLQTLLSMTLLGNINMVILPQRTRLLTLAKNDILWDKIIAIKRRKNNGYVYDFSVPDNESFICNNIIAHNTRELLLPKYLYWCPLTVRQPNPEGKGEVNMLDLLINSLRMRPDRIILGEMRKKEQAEVLFEAMHTGHSVYATVHADSIAETIQRLVNPPIEVPKNLLIGVNLNIVMFRDRRKGIRRVFQIGEFLPAMENGKQGIKPNLLYRWKPIEDELVEHGTSLRLFEELSKHTGMTMSQIEQDIMQKTRILEWMVKNDIRHVDQVGDVMKNYYTDKEALLEKIGTQ